MKRWWQRDPEPIFEYFRFVPARDITAYEIAWIVARLPSNPSRAAGDGVRFDPGAIDSLPPGIRRHFERMAAP